MEHSECGRFLEVDLGLLEKAGILDCSTAARPEEVRAKEEGNDRDRMPGLGGE